jgi:hypothetical protein
MLFLSSTHLVKFFPWEELLGNSISSVLQPLCNKNFKTGAILLWLMHDFFLVNNVGEIEDTPPKGTAP